MSNPPKAHTQKNKRAADPIAGLVAILLVGLLVAVLFVADDQTIEAQAEQATLARSTIAIRGQSMRASAVDYATWDDAYQQLVVSLNADWADANIGRWLYGHFGIDMSFVVTPDGRTTYAAVQGERDARPIEAHLTGGIDRLLSDTNDAGRGAAGYGVILADGRPAVATAVPIQPTSSPSSATASSRLVIVDLIEGASLENAELTQLLPHLRLEPPNDAQSPAIPLTTVGGQRAAMLVWDGDRPGDALLRMAIPVWLAVVAAFALLIVLGRRQARAAACRMAQAEHQATHDALTDLPNRVLLFRAIDEASRSLAEGGPPFAIVYLDLDGFKSVNDRHGHEAGDAVLRAAAGRMREIVGGQGTVARLGGDEFAMILFYGRRDRGSLQSLGQRLIRAIERPVPLDGGGEATVSATIGLSLAPDDGADPLVLLRNADRALYVGKRSGRRRVVFHPGTVLDLAGAA